MRTRRGHDVGERNRRVAALAAATMLSLVLLPPHAWGGDAPESGGSSSPVWKYDEVRGFFDVARRCAPRIDVTLSRVLPLRTLGAALWRLGDAKAARAAFEEALAIATSPDRTPEQRNLLLSLIAEDQVTAGDTDGARQTSRILAGDTALRELAIHQAKAGDAEGAKATARRIADPAVGCAYTLGSIARLQIEAGRLDAALETARDIEPGYERDRALKDVAVAYALAGEMVKATSAIGPVEDARTSAAWMAVAEALAAHGLVDEALALAEREGNEGWRGFTLGKIAELQIKRHEPERGLETLAKALEAVGPEDGRLNRLNLIVAAAVALAEAERTVDARKLVETIDEHHGQCDGGSCRAWALRTIAVPTAVAEVRAGDWRAARRTIGPDHDADWADFVRREIAAGEVAGALLGATQLRDASDRCGALHDVVSAQIESRDVGGAVRTANLIPCNAVRVAATVAIVRSQLASGEPDGALQTALAFRPPTKPSETEAARKGRRLDEKPAAWRDRAFADVAAAYTATGRADRARDVAARIEDETIRGDVLRQLDPQPPPEAVRARATDDEPSPALTWRDAMSLAEAGDTDGARAKARSLGPVPTPGPSRFLPSVSAASAMAAIARIQLRAGDPRGALDTLREGFALLQKENVDVFTLVDMIELTVRYTRPRAAEGG